MTQGAYELAMAQLTELGTMRSDLLRRIANLQQAKLGNAPGAQALHRNLVDVEATIGELNETIMAARASL